MKQHILLIEDDPLLIKMYQTKFVKEGYRVSVAGDGEEGWQKMKQNTPSFVVLDEMMPRLSGIDLLKQMRGNATLKHIPVLMLSNLSNQEMVTHAQELGVVEYLVKANFTPRQIVERVAAHLQQQSA